MDDTKHLRLSEDPAAGLGGGAFHSSEPEGDTGMKARELDFDTMRAINLNTESLKPGSNATPFSTFLWAVVTGDIAKAEGQIREDSEWGLVP